MTSRCTVLDVRVELGAEHADNLIEVEPFTKQLPDSCTPVLFNSKIRFVLKCTKTPASPCRLATPRACLAGAAETGDFPLHWT